MGWYLERLSMENNNHFMNQYDLPTMNTLYEQMP